MSTRLPLIDPDQVNAALVAFAHPLDDPSKERCMSDVFRAWAAAVGAAGCGRCTTAA